MSVDLFPPARTRKSVVSSKGKDDAGSIYPLGSPSYELTTWSKSDLARVKLRRLSYLNNDDKTPDCQHASLP